MADFSMENHPLPKLLARVVQALEVVSLSPNPARAITRAVIKDVDDPEERGRVRVLFDSFNFEEVPAVTNAGEYSESRPGKDEESFYSHWIDVSPPFKGKQPPGLIDKRVNLVSTNSQYQYAILQDVLYDPESLTDKAAANLTMPNNSTMVRLPIYPAGQLPLPVKENAGCMVIEEGGKCNSDWVCVCLKRNGKYIWVRHCDLAHGHASGNDVTSPCTSSGSRTPPGQMGTVGDCCFPTSDQQMKTYSAYGTNCRGNPYGEDAYWSPPPCGVNGDGEEIEPLEVEPPTLYSVDDTLDFLRGETEYEEEITGSFTPPPPPNIPAAVEPIPGINFAKDLISTGQKVLEVYQAARKAIEDPTSFLISVATKAAKNYLPDSTKQVVDSVSNPQGFIQTVYSSVKDALKL